MNRLLIAAVLVASACATTDSLGRQPRPLAATGDSPIAFGALGAKYEVPQRLKITDHDKKPGMVWFDFIDNNNGCVGAVVFYASSDRSRPMSYVSSATETDKQEFQTKGIDQGAFSHARYACDAHSQGLPHGGQGELQEVRGQCTVTGACALDQGDRACQGHPITGVQGLVQGRHRVLHRRSVAFAVVVHPGTVGYVAKEAERIFAACHVAKV